MDSSPKHLRQIKVYLFFLFAFILIFVSFGVCIYIQYFFDVVRNQTSNKIYVLELSKEDQK